MPSAPQIPEMPNEDPAMGGDIPQDLPDVDGDMGNENDTPEIPDTEAEGGDDSTMSIINQLSDEDRESVRAYAESMLNKNGGTEENEPEIPDAEEEIPQENFQESKRFTKKQLKEEFGPKTNSENESPLNQNKKRTEVKNGNPFNPPKFN